MKFLVAGHFAIDVVHRLGEQEKEQYGGIFHAVAALSALSGNNDRVMPVFGVNHDQHGEVIAALERLPNVDPAGVYPTDEPTHRVHISPDADGSVSVCAQDIMKPISFDMLRKHLSVDGVLVNMVSGFDITLETLDYLRMEIRPERIPLVFDYHNLTQGLTAKHERFRRPLENWRRWAFMVDILQLNQEEISGLTVEKLNELQTVGHMLTLGVKGVVVTRGSKGATLYHSEHKHVHRTDIPGIPADSTSRVIGCGDVFGAAMLVKYARTRDLVNAAASANVVAAARAAGRDYGHIRSLWEAQPSVSEKS